MHGYSTDSDERKIVPLLLASLAISLAWLFSKFLLVIHLSVPWWVDAPSVNDGDAIQRGDRGGNGET